MAAGASRPRRGAGRSPPRGLDVADGSPERDTAGGQSADLARPGTSEVAPGRATRSASRRRVERDVRPCAAGAHIRARRPAATRRVCGGQAVPLRSALQTGVRPPAMAAGASRPRRGAGRSPSRGVDVRTARLKGTRPGVRARTWLGRGTSGVASGRATGSALRGAGPGSVRPCREPGQTCGPARAGRGRDVRPAPRGAYIRARRARTFATNGIVTLYSPCSRTARSPWYQPASARRSLPLNTWSRWRR